MRRISLVSLVVPTLLAVSLSSSDVVRADARSWIKFHRTVMVGTESLGEFTEIATKDGLSPQKTRILYMDPVGARLVIRYETVFMDVGGLRKAQSTNISVVTPDTGETLTISATEGGQATVTLGSQSVSFADAEELPPAAKEAGLTVIASVSPGFQNALRHLAILGSYHVPEFDSIAFPSRNLFFHSIRPIGDPANDCTAPSEIIKDFDPTTHPPGSFEQPFGSAYYE